MPNSVSSAPRKQRGVDSITGFGLVTVIVFFLVSGMLSYSNTHSLRAASDEITHTHEVLTTLDDIIISLVNAETGQRGYLLAQNEKYLEPYRDAVTKLGEHMTRLELTTRNNPAQHDQIALLKTRIDAKLEELNETIQVAHTQGFPAAVAIVVTDRGKSAMDAIRAQVANMVDIEQELRKQRLAERERAYEVAVVSGVLTVGVGIFLAIAIAELLRRSGLARRRQQWLQAGEAGLAQAMLGDQRIEQLGDSILRFLSQYFDAHAGVFFIKDGNTFRRIAAYGIPADSKVRDNFGLGDGLLGQSARDRKTIVVSDVPEGYITVGSALGQDKPRHLIISPAASDEVTNAVLELGFIHPVDDLAQELLTTVSSMVGIAVRSANYRAELQDFLEETQRQAEELQAQGEELRVSNEELEEQSRALKDSQSRLEQQQAELEQTNSQLEEQTQILETQKDDLVRANSAVELKARELQEASQYKSDFLANMSHELRTPLNSSLILAKLLADNPDGNLTEEQVRHAQTIQSSGNDLLTLINDILDLSKIEAGHMEIRPETVAIKRLSEDMNRMFRPMAQHKGLAFNINIAPGSPDSIFTDGLRLEQVLRNLLSNAFKFTEKGSIELSIKQDNSGMIEFAVTDTGIGISEEQQKAVFDAFRQADSTISRKYGGTGLGLSISRELVRLLGGKITLVSDEGQGSTFAVSIPASYKATNVGSRSAAMSPSSIPAVQPTIRREHVSMQQPANIQPLPSQWIPDDRDRLSNGKRSLLVVEDDEPFARILYELSHELDFQCIVANTAEDALALAKQYLPSAVILDVGLPDTSGLSVLDRLKRDPRVRHIPVHIISGGDYAQTAFSMGAIGYMLKPVKREELAEVLRNIESRFDQRVRRVLIVEDDEVQRNAVEKLLGSSDVETVGAGTAAECLEMLKEQTFDCMVLDLSLPDASGYSLLETLSQEDAYSFPPVIVYTGRDLSADEEQRLHRYSKSIIIKGAKSPERLLDEVTLFLHQVVSDLPAEQQKMLQKARNRDAVLEGRRILVVEDDIRNVYSLTNILEPRGAVVQIARNGEEAITALQKASNENGDVIDLVLMDVMMPVMDGLTATREIRRNADWKKLPIIMLTAKAMRDDQERCLDAGANDYMAKPLDVEKLLSLVRVWMPR